MEVNEFQEHFKQKMEPLLSEWDSFPWHDKEAYGCFLKQINSWVSHSANLLALAGVNTNDFKLKARFFKHTTEEFGHEVSALKDLESLGFNADSFPELTPTKLFWRNQYYLVEKEFGEAFFGYVVALEGLAVLRCSSTMAVIDGKYDVMCSRFMRQHGDEDPEHLDQAFKNLEAVAPKKMPLIVDNFNMSVELLVQILQGAKSFSQR